MEFKARYVLNGLFAVAVVIAMFGFIYWLNNSAGFGERDAYQVRFTVPVSGLTTGSDVLFNGVKVGQVDTIRLDPARPDDIVATISIVRGVPVRTDTLAGIDYAGLTGAASILLTGGSVEAAPPASVNGMPPELVADPGASRSWTQKAGRILGVLDDVLEKNKGRFDTILSGLERLAGGGSAKEQPVTQDLPAAADFTPVAEAPAWQLAVGEPSVVLSLNTDRILREIDDAETQPMGEARWSDSLPNLFQARLVQSFENAGYFNAVRPFNAPDPDYTLVLDIRKYWLKAGDQPEAVIDLMARITDRNGKSVAVKRFQNEAAPAGDDEDATVAALRTVFATTAKQLVEWSVASIGAGAQ